MNFTTLSGVYENSRAVVRQLGGTFDTVSGLKQRLITVANDQEKLLKLFHALDNLESHVRVMGMAEVIKEGRVTD